MVTPVLLGQFPLAPAAVNAAATQASQVEALTSPRQSAMAYARLGLVPAVVVAKPVGMEEALPGSAAATRLRFAWKVLLGAYLLPSHSEPSNGIAGGSRRRSRRTAMTASIAAGSSNDLLFPFGTARQRRRPGKMARFPSAWRRRSGDRWIL
jgi:hypothetical protein